MSSLTSTIKNLRSIIIVGRIWYLASSSMRSKYHDYDGHSNNLANDSDEAINMQNYDILEYNPLLLKSTRDFTFTSEITISIST